MISYLQNDILYQRCEATIPVILVATVDTVGAAVSIAKTVHRAGIGLLEITLRSSAGLDAKRCVRQVVPKLCVGETKSQRDDGHAIQVELKQLRTALNGVELHHHDDCAIAYEPVWAIGTGVTASAAQAEEVHAAIRVFVAECLGDEVAGGLRIQYGGSVKPDNAAELFSQENIDGGLIGGAALDGESFAAIVKAVL